MSINGFIIYFIFISIIGYIYETLAMSIWSGKFENRGFLYGPIIPIYGISAVFGTILFHYYWTDATLLEIFLTGAIVSFLVEYPTHYFLEKVFHQRWWDYSKAPLNINGRVCLPATLGFGIAALIIVKGINPIIIPFINNIPDNIATILSLILVAIFAVDETLTISFIANLNEYVEYYGDKLDGSLENLFSHVLNEDKPFKDKAYKVLYAPSKIRKILKNKLRERLKKNK